jgi:tRNA-splicing ligase RtcB
MIKDIAKQISPVLWEIPLETKKGMIIPARIYASEEMLETVERDKSVHQLMNVAMLPGIQNYAIVMPDVHEGYGFPIGAVAATDPDKGVISPGGIGYDINCGVRLLKTHMDFQSIQPKVESLTMELFKHIPSGVGKAGHLQLSNKEMEEVLNDGCRWAEKRGFTEQGDLDHIESQGSLSSADAALVSKTAIDRGRDQLGTMGAGNHFVEIDKVDQILDEESAQVFGLFKDQIVIQIHTGSRGLGHQTATDYIKIMLNSMNKYGINLPDRELACTPFNSPEGQDYFKAMSASANFAWTNRQLITKQIRDAWRNIFGTAEATPTLLYDVAHNIAKIEEHKINGINKKVIVHRKGATRAFPAGHPEVSMDYRSVGQPVLIPGSMGTASYVLVGLPTAMEHTFGSTCHGSGRLMSRTAATKRINGYALKNELTSRGIVIQTDSFRGLAEEAPEAYKDVESIVNVVEYAGIAKKVARLLPLGVVKG